MKLTKRLLSLLLLLVLILNMSAVSAFAASSQQHIVKTFQPYSSNNIYTTTFTNPHTLKQNNGRIMVQSSNPKTYAIVTIYNGAGKVLARETVYARQTGGVTFSYSTLVSSATIEFNCCKMNSSESTIVGCYIW